VLEPGLLTTVQDLGRRGYERFGVPVAGAMDEFALRAANGLVGNPADAAGLEITLVGPRLRATENCLVAVCGADLDLHVGDRSLPGWMAVFVRRGWEISFGGPRRGCRAYLAVAGGIDVPPVMGSRSTYLRGGFGGFQGRALRAGDRLPVGAPAASPTDLAGRRLPKRVRPRYNDHPTLTAILGPQDDSFTGEGIAAFLSGEYRVAPTSDRMGYRLEGPAIAHKISADIVSDGVALGAVQVPAGGQPIVMMTDRQTTGGYAKIATVVRADMPLLAQCVPGESRVRFRKTTVEAAQTRYRAMMEALRGSLRAISGAA
jgi:biotin-dependent carboxylase-like uncharacterized protein